MIIDKCMLILFLCTVCNAPMNPEDIWRTINFFIILIIVIVIIIIIIIVCVIALSVTLVVLSFRSGYKQ